MSELTLQQLRELPFEMVLHLNMHKEYSRITENKEFGLTVCTNISKRGYKVVRRVLKASRLPDDYELDLMSTNLDAELEKFVEMYNSAQPVSADRGYNE